MAGLVGHIEVCDILERHTFGLHFIEKRAEALREIVNCGTRCQAWIGINQLAHQFGEFQLAAQRGRRAGKASAIHRFGQIGDQPDPWQEPGAQTVEYGFHPPLHASCV